MHTDIHASSGIRNHDPTVRVGEDGSDLRPSGHCDQRVNKYINKNNPTVNHDKFEGLWIEFQMAYPGLSRSK
jgi:hypothetical protein